MIQKGTAPKRLMKEYPGKGWSKSGLSCSVLSETNPYFGWTESAAHRCLLLSWTVDFWRACWPVRACVSPRSSNSSRYWRRQLQRSKVVGGYYVFTTSQRHVHVGARHRDRVGDWRVHYITRAAAEASYDCTRSLAL